MGFPFQVACSRPKSGQVESWGEEVRSNQQTISVRYEFGVGENVAPFFPRFEHQTSTHIAKSREYYLTLRSLELEKSMMKAAHKNYKPSGNARFVNNRDFILRFFFDFERGPLSHPCVRLD